MRTDRFDVSVSSVASATYPAAAGGNPPAFTLENMYGFSITVSSLAAQTGTLVIQASNDSLKTLLTSPATAVWVNILGASFVIAGANTFLGNFDATYYRWIRISHTRTGGAGVISCSINMKGS